MNSQNYKMPFNPEFLMTEGVAMPMCSEAESIANNLMLLITTKKRENRYDPEYGNDVWDIEFDNAVTTVEWEDIFAKSMQVLIQKYETRIYDSEIRVHIEYVEHSYETRQFSEVKKKAKIAINAKLTETGERYHFVTELFLSPMSID